MFAVVFGWAIVVGVRKMEKNRSQKLTDLNGCLNVLCNIVSRSFDLRKDSFFISLPPSSQATCENPTDFINFFCLAICNNISKNKMIASPGKHTNPKYIVLNAWTLCPIKPAHNRHCHFKNGSFIESTFFCSFMFVTQMVLWCCLLFLSHVT